MRTKIYRDKGLATEKLLRSTYHGCRDTMLSDINSTIYDETPTFFVAANDWLKGITIVKARKIDYNRTLTIDIELYGISDLKLKVAETLVKYMLSGYAEVYGFEFVKQVDNTLHIVFTVKYLARVEGSSLAITKVEPNWQFIHYITGVIRDELSIVESDYADSPEFVQQYLVRSNIYMAMLYLSGDFSSFTFSNKYTNITDGNIEASRGGAWNIPDNQPCIGPRNKVRDTLVPAYRFINRIVANKSILEQFSKHIKGLSASETITKNSAVLLAELFQSF